MKTFLSEVVQEHLQLGYPLADTVCVLPSERAGVFLKQEFRKQLSNTTFLPEVVSIEKFVEEISGFVKIDTVSLLFEFYEVYKNQCKGKDDFSVFTQWGNMALQDFNEVDRHLVDSEGLFSYLKDVSRIEKWQVDSEKNASQLVSNHLVFMENLGKYYRFFKEYLIENKKGYQGLLYRKASQKIDKFITDNGEKKFLLIGFNALNKAEEVIFQALLNSGIGKVYWDSDDYYLNSRKEAGTFLRKHKTSWKYFEKNPFNFISENFKEPKNIYEIAASKNVSQIKSVGDILSKQKNFENTALVLADESLLSLTLNSLPPNLDRLNITMGYFLKDMPIAGFFQTLFDLYLNQEKLDKIEVGAFYHKDVLRLLNHPFVYKLSKSIENLDVIKEYVVKNNHVFVAESKLCEIIEKVGEVSLMSLFSMSHNVTFFIERIHLVIYSNKDNFEGFEKECLFRYYNLFLQLESLNNRYKHITKIKTLFSIYGQLIATEKLSFQGEPLSGLQLMGMLETRVLDFETVIITSMNEGVLPAGKSENSFIPFDIKREYGLPTYQEKDAIFSYHFYRLIQRAKNVYLLYNTETDDYGSGEKSRFLTQMEIDKFPIKKFSVSPVVTSEAKEIISIQKTPEVITTLKQIAASGFSPSALSTYILDPLVYYKQYILKIHEVEEVEETVAANTLGTVIHDALEYFYKPFQGRFLKVKDVESMISKIDEITIFYFKKHYHNGDFSIGKNKLIFEVAKSFIIRFLKMELMLLKEGKKLKIIATEMKLEAVVPFEKYDFPIKIKGTVDRIDELDGVLRIIDYKSGKVVSNQLKINDFSVISSDYKYTKALQVMLYVYLYSQNNKGIFESTIESGIFSFRNMKSNFLRMNFGEGRKNDFNVTEERVLEFLEAVKNIIEELFDVDRPFVENIENPYK